jgi:hypothetical protein
MQWNRNDADQQPAIRRMTMNRKRARPVFSAADQNMATNFAQALPVSRRPKPGVNPRMLFALLAITGLGVFGYLLLGVVLAGPGIR